MCAWVYFFDLPDNTLSTFSCSESVKLSLIRGRKDFLWWITCRDIKNKNVLSIWEHVRLGSFLQKSSLLKKMVFRYCFLFSSPEMQSVVLRFLPNRHAEAHSIFVTWAQYFDTCQVLWTASRLSCRLSSAGVRLITRSMQSSEETRNFPGWAVAHVIYSIDSTSWLEFLINEES